MFNLKAMFKKKAESPIGETEIPTAGVVELDGLVRLVSGDGVRMTYVSNPVELKSWTTGEVVRSYDASYIQYSFNLVEGESLTPGNYSIAKVRTHDSVYVLADVELRVNNIWGWVAKTSKHVYVLGAPNFDLGFDYEQAEIARIAWEAEQARKRETEEHLAELIVNLLDDYADKDEEYHVKNDWSLGSVEVRGVFDFIGIGKILNSSNEEIDDLDFIYALAKSFRESQQEEYVQLVDSEFLYSVEVYGGTYDLIQVAKDVIAYIDDHKKEANNE